MSSARNRSCEVLKGMSYAWTGISGNRGCCLANLSEHERRRSGWMTSYRHLNIRSSIVWNKGAREVESVNTRLGPLSRKPSCAFHDALVSSDCIAVMHINVYTQDRKRGHEDDLSPLQQCWYSPPRQLLLLYSTPWTLNMEMEISFKRFFEKNSCRQNNRPWLPFSDCMSPDHLLLDSDPILEPLISRWEIKKFENCWYKSVRILEVLKFLFQQFLILSSSQQDIRGRILGDLSNNRWSGGTWI